MTMNSGGDAGAGSSRGRRSFIDGDSRFVGTYTTPNELQIEGQYEGTIDCSGLVLVGESADVNAHLTAGSVSVHGRLRGEVGCRGRFEIHPSGQVEAKVEAASIVVHDGAHFDGEMRMRTAGEAKIAEPAAASPELRPGRRTVSTEPSPLPRFQAEATRTNGRSNGGDHTSASEADRPGSSGQPSDPAARDQLPN
jgi:cytoskeletal protein CcmA (bactofilin family)